MEWLAAKCIKNPEEFNKLLDFAEQQKTRESEVQQILDFIDQHPEIYQETGQETPTLSRTSTMVIPDTDDEIVEITEEEAIKDDCKKVLEDIKIKLEKSFYNF